MGKSVNNDSRAISARSYAARYARTLMNADKRE
jgi:hypothetical protein